MKPTLEIIRQANEAALRSTCMKKQVGCVIYPKDLQGPILVKACNRSISGPYPKCKELKPMDHHRFHEKYEIHAEQLALIELVKNPVAFDPYDYAVYCTLEPCNTCYKLFIEAGFTEIWYGEQYTYVSPTYAVEGGCCCIDL